LSISASTKLPIFDQDESTELDDGEINKLYSDLVGTTGKKTVTSKKTKYARPATQNAPVVTITDIGQKAKSRLFDYKEKQSNIKTVQQMRKEAQDKRDEFQTKLKAGLA
jgi:hypothetical protein